MPFTLTGVQDVMRNLTVESRRISRAIPASVEGQTTSILAVAVQNAPERDGELRQSGRIEPIEVDGNTTKSLISFNARHAGATHEVHSRFDPPTWVGKAINFTVGGPKYLERALRASLPGLLRRIAFGLGLI